MRTHRAAKTGIMAWFLVIVAGIGAAGTVAYGMLFPDESTRAVKVVSVSLIVAGVIGLNLSGAAH
jgi:multidrug transporter EmrE-like cation transporter